MAQKQLDLSQDRFFTSLDETTTLEIIKRWGKIYVKITCNKSSMLLPLEKFALLKESIDSILLVAEFMQGIVGLNSLTPMEFDQSEER